jgi:peptidoglycan/LPS O-acetylase OafA/YrhL
MPRAVQNRNDGLQVARALACTGVLVSHAAYMAGVLTNSQPPAWLMRDLGSSGVYLFFVLSGYLMGEIIRRRRSTALAFLMHRGVRIYPAYWVAAALFCVMSYLSARPVPPFDITTLLLSPVMWGNSFYGVPAWTLDYEVIFYLIVAVMIAANFSLRIVSAVAIGWAATIVAIDAAFGQLYFHVLPGPFILLSCMNLLFISGLLVSIHEIKLAGLPTFILLRQLWHCGSLACSLNRQCAGCRRCCFAPARARWR